MQSAHRNKTGEWVIPQIYFAYHKNGETISRKKVLEKADNNALLQEAMQIEPRIRDLIEEVKKERCIPGYQANDRFYTYYKPRISRLAGFESRHRAIRTMKHYDAVYETVYELLPGDEWDLYADGIMPNGMYCPSWQEKYGQEYP